MCGFAGFVDAAPRTESPEAVVRAMAGTLERRGPDDEGFWHDAASGVHLGFRRLAILDLSEAGHQPMTSSSGRYVIAFNGEVYNFRELRVELAGHGFTFRGHSDTEVLLAAFERWGPRQAITRFRGMFAFALWDTVEHELWLARDRMGIKPLFVARRGGMLVFGSELRALLVHPAIERRGSTEAAWHYLRTLYVPAPLSIVEGVEKVQPGTLVRFSVGATGIEATEEVVYWSLEDVAAGAQDTRAPVDETAQLDELHELLRESVRLRLVADVPVGALLSGGVDSSLVVALMAEQTDRPVRTFTIRFDDPRFDEGPVAEEVARRLGADHTSVEMPTSRVRDLIPSLAQIADEPMANPSLLPTLLVCEVARRDVVVALTGDGGDELFGGYNRYLQAPRMIERAQRVPRPLRPFLERGMKLAAGLPGIERLGRMIQPSALGGQHSFASRLQRAAGIAGAAGEREAYHALLAVGGHRPPMRGGYESRQSVDGTTFDRHAGPLVARMMLLDQKTYLPDDLLAKVDRASMWTSLEARVPLLDHRVVELSWRMPDALKIRNGTSKYALRALTRRYLPDEVMQRPKMGFTVPIDRWLRQDLAEWLGDTLERGRLERRALYDTARVGRLHDAFRRGRADLALPLWTLAVLEDWAASRGVTF